MYKVAYKIWFAVIGFTVLQYTVLHPNKRGSFFMMHLVLFHQMCLEIYTPFLLLSPIFCKQLGYLYFYPMLHVMRNIQILLPNKQVPFIPYTLKSLSRIRIFY